MTSLYSETKGWQSIYNLLIIAVHIVWKLLSEHCIINGSFFFQGYSLYCVAVALQVNYWPPLLVSGVHWASERPQCTPSPLPLARVASVSDGVNGVVSSLVGSFSVRLSVA